MAHWQVLHCPHCDEVNLLDVQPSKAQFINAHAERKPIEQLGDHESEHEYRCEYCHKIYYVTLKRSSQFPFYGSWFFWNKERRRTG
jgi:hypothetical protein